MSYQINSAKDSHGDEQLFMEQFNQNRPAIEEYKRLHGGDLEGAFQAVTGKPWPSGRSVKLHNGVAEMTKDRTVKSVLGKYVLPIAGAAAAPWLIPYLASLGGGAAATTGIDVGVGGSGLGAGVGSAGTALAAGGTTAATTAAPIGGALASTSLATGSSALGGGLGFGAGLPAATSALGAGAGGGSTISGLLGKGKNLYDAGHSISAMSDQAAKNRSETGNFIQDWDKLNLEKEQERRLSESDALSKISRGAYIQNGGNPYVPAHVNSGQLPDFGFGPKAPSQQEVDAAKMLEPQLMDRLKPGAGWAPTPYEQYTKQGKWEKAGNVIGGVLGAYGSFRGRG